MWCSDLGKVDKVAADPRIVPIDLPYQFSGQFGTYRAAGVAQTRAQGQIMSLERARRSGGVANVGSYALGVPAVFAVLAWPFLLVWVTARSAGLGLRVVLGCVAVAVWLGLILFLRTYWRRTQLGRRRSMLAENRRQACLLGEAIADCSGAFNWSKATLRVDADGAEVLTVRRGGQSELVEPWTPELREAVLAFRRQYLQSPSPARTAEVIALRSGEVAVTLGRGTEASGPAR